MNQKVRHTAIKALAGIAIAAMSAYALFATFHFSHERENAVCLDIEVEIKDSTDIQFIHPDDVNKLVNKLEPGLRGSNMKTLNTTKLERQLVKKLVAVKKVECYKTPDSKLHINIWQRHPLLRIVKNTGYDMYLDQEGRLMPIPSLEPAFVPIATGAIADTFATHSLYEFAKYLKADKLWNAQIEQIHVKSNGEVNLVPRVGCHIIELGKLDNYQEKLGKLEKLYTEALPRKGWNIYSKINLKFDQQVICTRKEEVVK